MFAISLRRRITFDLEQETQFKFNLEQDVIKTKRTLEATIGQWLIRKQLKWN